MPFFGVPIRNGLPIGLGSVAGFGVQQFDPSELFVGGTVAGAWYDPSDLSTMFTTSAGTTPVAMPGGGSAVVVGRMLDKSGNGNHAISFNDTTARPELRARVNLLTYSEEFDNGVWIRTGLNAFGSGSVANTTATTDPLGGNTADFIQEDTSTGAHYIRCIGSAIGTTATASVYVKAAGRNFAYLYSAANTVSGLDCRVDLITGDVTNNAVGTTVTTTNVGNGWWRIDMIMTGTATGPVAFFFLVGPATAAGAGTPIYTGDGTSGIYIWGADLRPANIGANVPAYQRIADANTYDTSGFPLYLRFDGIDDSMYTPANLNLSGTDKVSVFAGVRSLSLATTAFIAELSAAFNSNAGTFGVYTENDGTIRFGRSGSVPGLNTANSTARTAPLSYVYAAAADLAGTTSPTEIPVFKINGTNATNSYSGTGDTGGGNFGTYPLYIGLRNNTLFPLNGHIYSLIIAGSAVSAGNISATEQWVAGKTGVVIP